MRRTCSRCGKRRKIAMTLTLTSITNPGQSGIARTWSVNCCRDCWPNIRRLDSFDRMIRELAKQV